MAEMTVEEYRVTWQIAKGHAHQRRIYQRKGAALVFYDYLKSKDRLPLVKFETRKVGDWKEEDDGK